MESPLTTPLMLSGSINFARGELTVHSTADFILHLACDVNAEPDSIPPPHTSGLPSRLCAKSLQEFSSDNLMVVFCKGNNRGDGLVGNFYTNTNLIARWANLGYFGETATRNHILQLFTSHPKPYDHQADTLVILTKPAGATFEAYADPSVVDRCFELLQHHEYYNPHNRNHRKPEEVKRVDDYDLARRKPVQVSAHA